MRTSAIEAAAPPQPPSQRLATEDYVDRKVAELESRLIKWGVGLALAIIAAVKVIPPAY